MTGAFFDCGEIHPGAAALSFEKGAFVFEEPLPPEHLARSSSRKKLVYRGVYMERGDRTDRSIPARAIFFDRTSPLDYSRERSGLTLGALLGIGPRLLEADELRPVPGASDAASPVIVEEDAGVSLEDALKGASVPLLTPNGEKAEVQLPKPSTPDGTKATHKILFDILSQVANMQARGLYHRDLRSANVALRFYGHEAEDLRATLLDLEFLTGRPRGRVCCSGYYDRLFEQGLLGRPPTPLEQDAGYLAVMIAEVLNGTCAAQLTDEMILAILRDARSPLVIDGHEVFSRRISPRDLEREARLAGLPTAEEVFGNISERAVDIAREQTMHGGYLDRLDLQRLGTNPHMILELKVSDGLAQAVWRNYLRHRRRDGLPVEYASFEEQPADLRDSCRSQARHMREKIELLGYEIVTEQECPESLRVRELSNRQVEFLAEAEHDRWVAERSQAGWIYGSVRSAERRTSPYLVPWEDLDETVREYNREPVRKIIRLLKTAGLAVRRYG